MHQKWLEDPIYGDVTYGIIIDPSGVYVEYDLQDCAPPMGRIPNEELDDTIVILTAVRNARIMNVKIDQLWRYEPGIGGGFLVGVKDGQCDAPHQDLEWFTILYLANTVVFNDRLIKHSYDLHLGQTMKAATKHLQPFTFPEKECVR